MLFADGLRYDGARQRQKGLEVMGITGSLYRRRVGLPTVMSWRMVDGKLHPGPRRLRPALA